MKVLHCEETSLSMFSTEGYQALRHGAGVVLRGDRGVLAVVGADRMTWLQGLLTNDVLALPIGGVQDAAYLTPQGRLITDLRVVNLPDRALLDVPGSLAESLQARLDGLLFSEDAQVTNVSQQTAVVDVHGPLAPSVVGDLESLVARYGAIVADNVFGIPGYSLFVSKSDEEMLVRLLVEHGGQRITLETLDVIRVEAGRPAFLIDMDEHTIPLEAGIEDRAISFTKGCYVGQEVIVRVMHRGQGRVAKRLVGLRLAKGVLPERGSIIVGNGRDIGRITSAVWSPTLEGGIALGYVQRDFAAPGTTVLVQPQQNEGVQAEVSALPFVESTLPTTR
jgi:folate-binding protein YgfZ